MTSRPIQKNIRAPNSDIRQFKSNTDAINDNNQRPNKPPATINPDDLTLRERNKQCYALMTKKTAKDRSMEIPGKFGQYYPFDKKTTAWYVALGEKWTENYKCDKLNRIVPDDEFYYGSTPY